MTGVTADRKLVLAYGVWREWKAMPGLPPSPTTGLHKRLAKQYAAVDVEEYNTTKLCCRCHGETTYDDDCKRTRTKTRKDGKTIEKEVPKRGIRRCDSEKCKGLRWNRDLNAAINIRCNLLYAIQNSGQWHPKFRRPPMDLGAAQLPFSTSHGPTDPCGVSILTQ